LKSSIVAIAVTPVYKYMPANTPKTPPTNKILKLCINASKKPMLPLSSPSRKFLTPKNKPISGINTETYSIGLALLSVNYTRFGALQKAILNLKRLLIIRKLLSSSCCIKFGTLL
jgi:hypothetical protein